MNLSEMEYKYISVPRIIVACGPTWRNIVTDQNPGKPSRFCSHIYPILRGYFYWHHRERRISTWNIFLYRTHVDRCPDKLLTLKFKLRYNPLSKMPSGFQLTYLKQRSAFFSAIELMWNLIPKFHSFLYSFVPLNRKWQLQTYITLTSYWISNFLPGLPD